MTHLYASGNPKPYRAFTLCGLDVSTREIVAEDADCVDCEEIEFRKFFSGDDAQEAA